MAKEFDPDTPNIPPAELTAKFTIAYTNAIYRGKQHPSVFFTALSDLIFNGTINPGDVEVKFYGDEEDWLAREIENYELSNIVELHGQVPRQIAFEKQRESQLSSLLNWDDYRIKEWHSLKICAYIAAQRPTLAIGGSSDGVVKELLDETKTDVYSPSVEDVKSSRIEPYSEYKQKGKIDYSGDLEKINKYNYREMEKKFAEILDS